MFYEDPARVHRPRRGYPPPLGCAPQVLLPRGHCLGLGDTPLPLALRASPPFFTFLFLSGNLFGLPLGALTPSPASPPFSPDTACFLYIHDFIRPWDPDPPNPRPPTPQNPCPVTKSAPHTHTIYIYNPLGSEKYEPCPPTTPDSESSRHLRISHAQGCGRGLPG